MGCCVITETELVFWAWIFIAIGVVILFAFALNGFLKACAGAVRIVPEPVD